MSSLSELEARQLVVQEAMTWVGTPYISNGNLKVIGVDCAMIMVMIFSNTGLIEFFDPRPYPPQWAIHQKTERYLETILKFAGEIEGDPQPGDLVLCQFGHCWAHGALVVGWPTVIHANPPGNCRIDNYVENYSLRKRKVRFFSYWQTTGYVLPEYA